MAEVETQMLIGLTQEEASRLIDALEDVIAVGGKFAVIYSLVKVYDRIEFALNQYEEKLKREIKNPEVKF